MPRYTKKQLYVKRVFREIRRHSDDKWIDTEIEKDLNSQLEGKSDAEIKRDMPSPSFLAIRYRLKYAESASAPDGFTPHSVRRLFKNFLAPALELLAAFCVFRLYPTTEYIAYAVCALAAVAAAIQQHVCFCKLRYIIIALAAPPFLLIWYPAKAAASASGSVPEFFSRLFSDGNRYVLILIFSFIFFYFVTAAFLHARDYTDSPVKALVMIGSVAAAAASVVVFVLCAHRTEQEFDRLAAESFAELETSYAEFLSSGSSGQFISAAEKADGILSPHYHAYAKMNVSYNDEFAKMARLLALCEQSRSSGSYQALLDEYYTSYDESDESRTLDTEKIDLSVVQAESRFESRLSALSSGGCSELYELSQTAGGLYSEIYAVIDGCFSNWIFSPSEEN